MIYITIKGVPRLKTDKRIIHDKNFIAVWSNMIELGMDVALSTTPVVGSESSYLGESMSTTIRLMSRFLP